MGPSKGIKKRRKPEKKHDSNGSVSGSPHKEGPLDWWHELSKRMNGKFLIQFLIYLSIFFVNDECVGYYIFLFYKFSVM